MTVGIINVPIDASRMNSQLLKDHLMTCDTSNLYVLSSGQGA